jgi:hypothetical protein
MHTNGVDCKTAGPGATNGNRAGIAVKHEGIGMTSLVTDRVATLCRLITVRPVWKDIRFSSRLKT